MNPQVQLPIEVDPSSPLKAEVVQVWTCPRCGEKDCLRVAAEVEIEDSVLIPLVLSDLRADRSVEGQVHPTISEEAVEAAIERAADEAVACSVERVVLSCGECRATLDKEERQAAMRIVLPEEKVLVEISVDDRVLTKQLVSRTVASVGETTWTDEHGEEWYRDEVVQVVEHAG